MLEVKMTEQILSMEDEELLEALEKAVKNMIVGYITAIKSGQKYCPVCMRATTWETIQCQKIDGFPENARCTSCKKVVVFKSEVKK